MSQLPRTPHLNRCLVDWQRVLLNEATSLGYRISPDGSVTPYALEDLAFALESLAARVRREIPARVPPVETPRAAEDSSAPSEKSSG